MNVVIDNIDFWNLPAMKYYGPPVSWSSEKKKEYATNRIFSGTWLSARKRDGIWMMFIKDMDGNIYLRPRAKNTKGEFVNKVDWVSHLHDFFNDIDNGTVFLGELYAPWDEQAKTTTSIMNCLLPKALKRQESEDRKLHYYIFDILAENGKSYIDMKAKDRFDILKEFHRAYGEKYWHWANYLYGQDTWRELQSILAEGGEGVVIINEDSPYRPGKRSTKDTLKIKKELEETLDCIIIGAQPPTKNYTGKEIENWVYWYDVKTTKRLYGKHFKDYEEGFPIIPVTKNWYNNWAGSFKLGVYKDGKVVEIGNLAGLTDEMKENWSNYVGKVAEVSVMEIMTSEDGSKGLRHPKFLGCRSDKEPKDCLYSQLI